MPLRGSGLFLVEYASGKNATFYPPDAGLLLPAGRNARVSYHFHSIGDAPLGSGVPRSDPLTSGDGQLRHALASQSERLVATPSAFRLPLCADQFQLA